ncbi:MAG: hypothetical protein JWO15_2986 [Sphingomonadales bacterium]|nr:hypothetical protein [Sphingomonadales bacterium]
MGVKGKSFAGRISWYRRGWACSANAILAGVAVAMSTIPARAQIIDENTVFLLPAQNRVQAGFEVFSDLRYANNALATSNLPGGLDENSVSSTIWVKGLTGYVVKPVADGLALYVAGAAYHANYFKFSDLNHFGFVGTGGVQFMPNGASEIHIGGRCANELTAKGLNSFYNYCGPIAGASVRIGNARKIRLHLRADGSLALGKSEAFARYSQLTVAARIEIGKTLVFSVEPSATVQDFKPPTLCQRILTSNGLIISVVLKLPYDIACSA